MSEKIAHFPENQLLRNGNTKFITLQRDYVMAPGGIGLLRNGMLWHYYEVQ